MIYNIHLYDAACRSFSSTAVFLRAFKESNAHHLASGNPSITTVSGPCVATLNWPNVSEAVRILFDDPSSMFTASSVVGLNGQASGSFDMVVRALPASVHGGGPPSGTASTQLITWIAGAPNWSSGEKHAAFTLLENYRALAPYAFGATHVILKEILEVARNYEHTLQQIGFDPEWVVPVAFSGGDPADQEWHRVEDYVSASKLRT